MSKGPSRAEELLAAAADLVLQSGLQDLSLRSLAERLGTSHRMLIYYFGSKEAFMQALLRRLRITEQMRLRDYEESPASPAERMLAAWDFLASEPMRAHFKLLFEVYGAAIRDPERYQAFLDDTVREWLPMLEMWGDLLFPELGERNKAGARLQLAVTRGLLLDLLTTDDLEGVREAMRLHAELLESYANRLTP